jgi:hypothetical protein
MRTTLFIIDAVVDLALGFFLVFFPVKVLELLGLPVEAPPFYAVILGGVLIGIGIALLFEACNGHRRVNGLGLGGAMIINLFAALTLAALLISGRMFIPLRGYLILLGLTFFLLLLCGVELLVSRPEHGQSSRKTDG